MIPEAMLQLIRRFEGLRLRPYLCPALVPTIGYGHTGADVRLDMPPITREEAERLLLADAGFFYSEALRLSPVLALAGADKQAAIADFCFNLGATRYAASTLRRRVNAQNWPGAAIELRRWVWGGGKKLPGLVTRREAEAELILRGSAVANDSRAN